MWMVLLWVSLPAHSASSRCADTPRLILEFDKVQKQLVAIAIRSHELPNEYLETVEQELKFNRLNGSSTRLIENSVLSARKSFEKNALVQIKNLELLQKKSGELTRLIGSCLQQAPSHEGETRPLRSANF